MTELPTFHDARLVSVHLDWASAVATIELRVAQHTVPLRILDCTDVCLPRREEWGRSVSVMSAQYLDGHAEVGLVVEMQTGDRLVFRGRVSLEEG